MKELLRVVGLTGGMGAGKSTLVEVAKEMGIVVWDADKAVHALYEESDGLKEELRKKIGVTTRKEVAALISEKPEMLHVVEEILDDWIEADFQIFMEEHKDAPFVLMDAPLLFEGGWESMCDSVIAIQCPIEVRKARCMMREGMTDEKFAALSSRQISEGQRLFRSQYIIHNDGFVELAKDKMRQILTHLQEFYK